MIDRFRSLRIISERNFSECSSSVARRLVNTGKVQAPAQLDFTVHRRSAPWPKLAVSRRSYCCSRI